MWGASPTLCESPHVSCLPPLFFKQTQLLVMWCVQHHSLQESIILWCITHTLYQWVYSLLILYKSHLFVHPYLAYTSFSYLCCTTCVSVHVSLLIYMHVQYMHMYVWIRYSSFFSYFCFSRWTDRMGSCSSQVSQRWRQIQPRGQIIHSRFTSVVKPCWVTAIHRGFSTQAPTWVKFKKKKNWIYFCSLILKYSNLPVHT